MNKKDLLKLLNDEYRESSGYRPMFLDISEELNKKDRVALKKLSELAKLLNRRADYLYDEINDAFIETKRAIMESKGLDE